jgi:hypothetical protein
MWGDENHLITTTKTDPTSGVQAEPGHQNGKIFGLGHQSVIPANAGIQGTAHGNGFPHSRE